ncbi:hypothetical protein HNQ96_001436 [Aminobacter lissarensis]|uniref:Uncharacterized protein n=1 Tax=Aminobacter carboxidus TaxID=376165 RepID=A0A8E2BB90_9HYPH|nr:hypothetical protein [Aminobacter lissarensis]MBB6465578.1 hypothetical protein [Aminobacter lissarensis]
MWRLLVPLRYLRISHPEKIKFDLYFPVVFAICLSLPLLSEKFRADAQTTLDILGRSSDLLSILIGFFVAALAAVATFGGEGMDEPMAGAEPVTLLNQAGNADELSRRRFLSYLFGYLALASIFIYLLGFTFYGAQTYLISAMVPAWANFSFVAFWMIYALLLGNLLSNTLLGLFYLTDRIHRPNRVVTFKGKANPKSNDSKAA